jgi:hypothetical protein
MNLMKTENAFKKEDPSGQPSTAFQALKILSEYRSLYHHHDRNSALTQKRIEIFWNDLQKNPEMTTHLKEMGFKDAALILNGGLAMREATQRQNQKDTFTMSMD